MSKNTVKMNGAKFKELMISTTGKSLGEIAIENGYSRSLLNEAVRTNRASPIIQTLARLYGIAPEAYIIKETKPAEKKGEQVSLFDPCIDRDELKAIIKEAIGEFLTDYKDKDTVISFDPRTNSYTLMIRINKEGLI